MLRFILFAVIAFFLYQIVMGMNWGRVQQDAEQSGSEAVRDVENSRVGRGVSEGVDAIRDLFR